MEERYKLLLTVLRELSNAEVLDDLILAGSWCQFYYRILFDEAPEIPLIRTTDIDFLVPNPSKIKKSVDQGYRRHPCPRQTGPCRGRPRHRWSARRRPCLTNACRTKSTY